MAKLARGICRACGCTDSNCQDCVERTGRPCHWVEPNLCSACTPRFEVLGLVVAAYPPARAGEWVYTVCPPGGDPADLPGDAGQNLVDVVELHLPPDLWAVARRVLPALAKLGRLSL